MSQGPRVDFTEIPEIMERVRRMDLTVRPGIESYLYQERNERIGEYLRRIHFKNGIAGEMEVEIENHVIQDFARGQVPRPGKVRWATPQAAIRDQKRKLKNAFSR